MSASTEPQAFDQQAPFLGHPFGGLVREDRIVPRNDGASLAKSGDADPPQAHEDAGGFDFHLGVYSRF